MKELHSILRSRPFWRGAALLFALQMVLLLLSTPMYDLDTNSYIRGGLSWDIYHNPFLNIYLAVLGKIWPNAWFLVSGQIAFFAISASLLVQVLFADSRWQWAGLAVAALEPLTMFYNFSLLAESFFTSFLWWGLALAILWLRHRDLRLAAGIGTALGGMFLCKLSALILLPLLGFLLWPGIPLRRRAQALLWGLGPFVLAYAFVFIGQKTINEGDLYTVEGRVRWDFGSALYDSSQVESPLFKRFVQPRLYVDGEFVSHRELRRELSYLGYKDCVQWYESQGASHNQGINRCDSIFGDVAAQVLEGRFWEAEVQFVKDNFHFLHHLNYIDYRFTPGLHYYHPEAEWAYLDSLMETHYGLNLAHRQDRIPGVWTSLRFGNVYMPLIWWLWWLGLAAGAWLLWQSRDRWPIWVIGGLSLIPLVFHLVYISYRPRFLAPYLVAVWLLLLWEAREFLRMRDKAGENH